MVSRGTNVSKLMRRGRVAAAALLLALLYAREVETRWVEVEHLTLTLPRLAPEFDGYRLVQFGDFHLDDWTKPERLNKVVEKVNEQRPDLIAITGDFASYSARELDTRRLTDALRALRVPNKTSLRQLRVDLGHAVRSAPHRSFRSRLRYP